MLPERKIIQKKGISTSFANRSNGTYNKIINTCTYMDLSSTSVWLFMSVSFFEISKRQVLCLGTGNGNAQLNDKARFYFCIFATTHKMQNVQTHDLYKYRLIIPQSLVVRLYRTIDLQVTSFLLLLIITMNGITRVKISSHFSLCVHLQIYCYTGRSQLSNRLEMDMYILRDYFFDLQRYIDTI